MEDQLFPLMNPVWFSLYGGKNGGVSAYTCGMESLGYDEIEILDSKASGLRRIKNCPSAEAKVLQWMVRA